MKIVHGGITQAKGFTASGIHCGLKNSGNEDLSLIFSEIPAVTAGVFTKNSVVAAPLTLSKKYLKNHQAQAIIVNSGNANCFTGEIGYAYAEKMASVTAELLSIKKSNTLVSSTGIIGKPLPIKKIESGIPELVNQLSKKGSKRCARGLMTTDLVVKERAVQFNLDSKIINCGGCAKGSGMIAPNMATMLGFITTDVAISYQMLKKALKQATDESFNCITVDGCMSTNDMVVVMANGLAGNPPIVQQGKDYDKFYEALKDVCLDLAKKIVLDGEGASKFVEIHVLGATSHKEAREVGLAIANSILVKTALFGSNPNWGRVAAAVGSLGIRKVNEDNLKISFSPFKRKNVSITADLNIGKAKATVFTSDLSHEYIRINTEYN